MKNTIIFFALLFVLPISIFANEREIVLGSGHFGNGLDQIYIENPRVTYEDELNELSVYFGSTSTFDLECVDATGTPYYYIYGEYHPACDTATYSNLPPGYYTITIHSVYGITYTGNFTVN